MKRILKIVGVVVVLFAIMAIMRMTSFGLQMRAVTQNRSMAGCIGIPVDFARLVFAAAGKGDAAMRAIVVPGPARLVERHHVDEFGVHLRAVEALLVVLHHDFPVGLYRGGA